MTVDRAGEDAQMNKEWALQELEAFLKLTELYWPPDPPEVTSFSSHLRTRGAERDIMASAQVVEQILNRVLPRWRTDVPADKNKTVNRWYQHREAAERVRAALIREEEVRRNLGDDAPRLSASHLHPWIRDGARALWSSGHYREAVGAAARKCQRGGAEQDRRRDVSETDLFKQASRWTLPSREHAGSESERTTGAGPIRACPRGDGVRGGVLCSAAQPSRARGR